MARDSGRAEVGARTLQTIVDRSELIGLGDLVDMHGSIPAGERARIVDVVAAYQSLGREAGAQRLTLVGTEPLRRATNTSELARDLFDATGVALHVIEVHQEARLTFLGVTEGRAPAQPMMVVDIGGGSTEVCLYLPNGPLQIVAIPLGSARLTAAHVQHDPPTAAEFELLGQAVAQMRDILPTGTYFEAHDRVLAVFVGGTATNVARLGRLTRGHLAEDRSTLGQLDADQVMRQFGVRPRRARQMAAGVAIVDALLEHFGLDEALTSEASLRDGAIIADWLLGDEWPERLGELVG